MLGPMRETPIGIGQHPSNWAPRPRVRTHPEVFQHALGCAKPQPCASQPAELGPALRRPAWLRLQPRLLIGADTRSGTEPPPPRDPGQ